MVVPRLSFQAVYGLRTDGRVESGRPMIKGQLGLEKEDSAVLTTLRKAG